MITRRLCFVIIVACLLMVTACSRRSITYVDEDAPVTRQMALDRADAVSPKDLATQPVAEASALRHEALTSLRSYGEGAESAAALITRTFPADTPSVPFYVEEIRYDGKPALLVIEAIGRRGGRLTDERVWVIDESGNVLLSGVR